MTETDVVIIGGGPAGLEAAISANDCGAKVLLIEREERLGGILKQCIHDGFGLLRFNLRLSGPEYAERFIDEFNKRNLDSLTQAFVTDIVKNEDGSFILKAVTKEGIKTIHSHSIVLATGCRERTGKQVFIHGTRPSGIYTAGTAQYLINILGLMPCKKCVILGSGDIGLIMARRLTLEGGKILGVYEAKSTPSGLERNLLQCLYDYNIPLYLSKTVTRVFGKERLEGVEIASVDEKMNPLKGNEEYIACDGLILSVGLIPENELAEKLGVEIDPRTKGPKTDQNLMTSVDGVFSCGNSLHVNDLVDYVTESGQMAGKAAAEFICKERKEIPIQISEDLAYSVPQLLSLNEFNGKFTIYFRVKKEEEKPTIRLNVDGKEVFKKTYLFLRPTEMQKIQVDLSACNLQENSLLKLEMSKEA
ncbi:MAG: NAD(P)/FAD-dependent oxidoreductase [Bacilli bacterium]|jgi:NADPH-dependent 2,4-dienoyl-CoA reductase/sulfur reductase-like enzyme|nr:NAD(P)/FAD-dependent oxidoreductase [Bacilli bacterium]